MAYLKSGFTRFKAVKALEILTKIDPDGQFNLPHTHYSSRGISMFLFWDGMDESYGVSISSNLTDRQIDQYLIENDVKRSGGRRPGAGRYPVASGVKRCYVLSVDHHEKVKKFIKDLKNKNYGKSK